MRKTVWFRPFFFQQCQHSQHLSVVWVRRRELLQLFLVVLTPDGQEECNWLKGISHWFTCSKPHRKSVKWPKHREKTISCRWAKEICQKRIRKQVWEICLSLLQTTAVFDSAKTKKKAHNQLLELRGHQLRIFLACVFTVHYGITLNPDWAQSINVVLRPASNQIVF